MHDLPNLFAVGGAAMSPLDRLLDEKKMRIVTDGLARVAVEGKLVTDGLLTRSADDGACGSEPSAELQRLDFLVPFADDRSVSIISEHAYRGRIEIEIPACVRGETNPACGENPQQVTVREDRDIAIDRFGQPDDTPSALLDLLDRLSSWHAIVPNRPAGPFLQNVCWPKPFVFTVVPLHQIVGEPGDLAVAGQPARLGGTDERAGQHQVEFSACQIPPKRLGLFPACLGQRQIRASGMLSANAPSGLSVAEEPDFVPFAIDHGGPRFDPGRPSIIRMTPLSSPGRCGATGPLSFRSRGSLIVLHHGRRQLRTGSMIRHGGLGRIVFGEQGVIHPPGAHPAGRPNRWP